MDTSYDHGPIRSAEDLRAVLRQAELDVADLKTASPEEAVALLHVIDDLEGAIPRLEGEYRVDLKPERTRLQTLENILRSRRSLVVRRAGVGRLELERERVNPSHDEWWWFLDLSLAADRQRRLRRLAAYGLAAALVLLVATVAYNAFLAPSPEERALAQSLSDGESYLLAGDFEGARKEFEAALEMDPGDAQNHLYLAVALEALGETERADEEFAEGRRLSDSDSGYHANLALIYYRVAANGTDEAALVRTEEEARAAIAADAESALGHFALASAYELQGNTVDAIAEFETASSLSADASLTVLARMRMGMLMQSGSSYTSTGTVEATAAAAP